MLDMKKTFKSEYLSTNQTLLILQIQKNSNEDNHKLSKLEYLSNQLSDLTVRF